MQLIAGFKNLISWKLNIQYLCQSGQSKTKNISSVIVSDQRGRCTSYEGQSTTGQISDKIFRIKKKIQLTLTLNLPFDLRTHRCCRWWPCGWSPEAAPSQPPPTPPAAPPSPPESAGCLHKISPDLKNNMFHHCLTFTPASCNCWNV